MADSSFLRQSYDTYARIEQEFNDTLDQSLEPRGPELLFDLIADIGIDDGAVAVDVGCGEGKHAIELARRFHLDVLGVDPVPRHIAIATRDLSQAVTTDPRLSGRVRFDSGRAERLPAASASVDLIWCRDVLVHVQDLDAAYAEFRRVLKPHGIALVYQMFATERLEAGEAEWLLPTMGCIPENMQPRYTEAAILAAQLQIDRCVILGSEWGEYAQERAGKGGRKLLHAARLLRDPERYNHQYGRANYDIALGDALWHVYRLIGKLSDRVYVLSPRPS